MPLQGLRLLSKDVSDPQRTTYITFQFMFGFICLNDLGSRRRTGTLGVPNRRMKFTLNPTVNRETTNP